MEKYLTFPCQRYISSSQILFFAIKFAEKKPRKRQSEKLASTTFRCQTENYYDILHSARNIILKVLERNTADLIRNRHWNELTTVELPSVTVSMA